MQDVSGHYQPGRHGRSLGPLGRLSGAPEAGATPLFTPSAGEETKTAIILDTETTGLDPLRHEIIELGMVKFDYLPDGSIVGVRDVFSAFNEPSEPIPAEITDITGITDEMVAGHRIDDAAVAAFVDPSVVICIAHNSAFDRKFVERYWPVFARKRGDVRRAR